ncbi:hypothetical protein N0389_30625, partial [Pseudomonas aeruginosa]|nr:hypothetical protein [Pseudomonas aeruginosa]
VACSHFDSSTLDRQAAAEAYFFNRIGQKQPPEAVYEKKVYSQYQSIRLKHLATFPRLRSHKCTSRVASATPGPSDS